MLCNVLWACVGLGELSQSDDPPSFHIFTGGGVALGLLSKTVDNSTGFYTVEGLSVFLLYLWSPTSHFWNYGLAQTSQ